MKLEFDCGAAAAAGHDPVQFLQQHGGRVALLHLTGPRADWKRVIAAAKAAGVRRAYVAVDDLTALRQV